MMLRDILRTRFLSVLAAILAVGAAASTASAQRFRGQDRENTKGANAIRSVFKDVVVDANEATVRVRCQNKDVAMGTIVTADGYILTKASELKGDASVLFRDGSEKQAKVVGVAEDDDLAMLKVDATDLLTVKWADAKAAIVGEWVATTGMSDAPSAVGVLSVGRRKIPGRNGLLGVMLADGKGGAKVMQVIPESPAEKAGIHVDDVIAKVNQKSVDSREALITIIHSYMPGQEVTLEIRRGDKQIETKAKLVGGIGPASRAEIMNTMGGELSLRNANFPVVLQHDTVLTPSQCGGPLVTLDGKALGINIARAGRVESYAIPADVIVSLLPDLMNGKLAPKSQEQPTTKPAEKKNES